MDEITATHGMERRGCLLGRLAGAFESALAWLVQQRMGISQLETDRLLGYDRLPTTPPNESKSG